MRPDEAVPVPVIRLTDASGIAEHRAHTANGIDPVAGCYYCDLHTRRVAAEARELAIQRRTTQVDGAPSALL